MNQSGCYGAQINGEQLTEFLDKFLFFGSRLKFQEVVF